MKKEDRPEPGKLYRLTGGSNEPAISNGNSWGDSQVGGAVDVAAKIRARVQEYVKIVQKLQFSNGLAEGIASATFGPKYARIVVADRAQRWVHSFVNLVNGDVLKPAGWKGPELKNPRSNIFADDVGLSGIEAYGVRYLR